MYMSEKLQNLGSERLDAICLLHTKKQHVKDIVNAYHDTQAKNYPCPLMSAFLTVGMSTQGIYYLWVNNLLYDGTETEEEIATFKNIIISYLHPETFADATIVAKINESFDLKLGYASTSGYAGRVTFVKDEHAEMTRREFMELLVQ